jgi:hypothetical protein
MFEFDVYAKVDGTLKGRLMLEQSGVMANSAFEAVRIWMRDEGKTGSASQYTARRASLNSASVKERGAW